jgi:hypothetical protein
MLAIIRGKKILIHLYMVWLCVFPPGETQVLFMSVAMGEHDPFNNQVFRFGKVYNCNSIINTDFVWTLVPNYWFENIFHTYFRTQQKLYVVRTELIKYTYSAS